MPVLAAGSTGRRHRAKGNGRGGALSGRGGAPGPGLLRGGQRFPFEGVARRRTGRADGPAVGGSHHGADRAPGAFVDAGPGPVGRPVAVRRRGQGVRFVGGRPLDLIARRVRDPPPRPEPSPPLPEASGRAEACTGDVPVRATRSTTHVRPRPLTRPSPRRGRRSGGDGGASRFGIRRPRLTPVSLRGTRGRRGNRTDLRDTETLAHPFHQVPLRPAPTGDVPGDTGRRRCPGPVNGRRKRTDGWVAAEPRADARMPVRDLRGPRPEPVCRPGSRPCDRRHRRTGRSADPVMCVSGSRTTVVSGACARRVRCPCENSIRGR